MTSVPVSLAVALVALLVTYALTPLVRRVAERVGAIDYPGGRRINTEPTPRLGGIAIYAGFVAAAAVAMIITRPIELVGGNGEMFIRIPITLQTDRGFLGIMLGGTFLLAVGIYDDVRGMNTAVKFDVSAASGGRCWGTERPQSPRIEPLDM